MKSLFLSLLAVLLLTISTQASPRHPRHHGRRSRGTADTEVAKPTPIRPELEARAAYASSYYADVLRLSYSQTLAVHHATLKLLQEQDQDSTQFGQEIRYDVAMMRVLRPAQYSTFRALDGR
jgi:hypothetical protein